jgi:hypothetical protein
MRAARLSFSSLDVTKIAALDDVPSGGDTEDDVVVVVVVGGVVDIIDDVVCGGEDTDLIVAAVVSVGSVLGGFAGGTTYSEFVGVANIEFIGTA